MPYTVSQLVGKLFKHGQILLIYPAAFDVDREPAWYPLSMQHNIENVKLNTVDGVTLSCLFIPSSKKYDDANPPPTVILFHGNGYHVWHHARSGVAFATLGFNVLMVSYRGYGHSTGIPSQKGLRIDADTALEYVQTRRRLSKTIILHGHSLGGAVAVDLASRHPTEISALILENTFLSIPHVVRNIPVLKWMRWIIHQRWSSYKRMALVPRDIPICLLSGTKDKVVPFQHMETLWDISQKRGERGGDRDSEPKRPRQDVYKEFSRGDHPDTMMQQGYWKTIHDFLVKADLCTKDLHAANRAQEIAEKGH